MAALPRRVRGVEGGFSLLFSLRAATGQKEDSKSEFYGRAVGLKHFPMHARRENAAKMCDDKPPNSPH